MTAKRTKRFKIEKDEAIPPYRPVEDDFHFLRYALRRRLVNTEHLKHIFSNRSAQGLVRRLRILMKNGLMDKPGGQAGIPVVGGGSLPHIVAVSDAGARAVAKHFDLDLRGSNRSRDNKKLTPQGIAEVLDTTAFMVQMELSALKRNHVVMRDSFDILQDVGEQQRKKSKPKSFTTRVDWAGKNSTRGINPDEIVHLHYADRPADQKKDAYFFVEVDRETETIEPREEIRKSERFFRQSYVLLKFVIYGSAFRAKKVLPFGFTAFRVLMVTTTPSHMKLMQEVERRYLGSNPFKIRPGFILFSNQEMVKEHSADLLEMPWQDGSGKEWYLDGRGSQ